MKEEKNNKDKQAQAKHCDAAAEQPKAASAVAEDVASEAPKEPTLEEKFQKLSDEAEKLKEENAKLQKTVARLQSSADKSDMYLTQLVAMKNDFESYKRRMKAGSEQAKAEGVQSVAVKLIDIADTFEIAEKHIADEETLKAFAMIHRQFEELLQNVGVVKTEVLGEKFDHNTMNALSQMDRGEENKGKVVEVYKNGYRMGEKVIRYAQVIVGA